MNQRNSSAFADTEREQWRITRREFIAFGTATTGSLFLAGCNLRTAPTAPQAASEPDPAFEPDLELALTATSTSVALLPGEPTQIWHFQSELLQGANDALQTLDNYLGPIIRVQRGQKVRIHFHNDLEEESVIHWHGLLVPEAMDGHPRFAIAPGTTYVYEFEVQNRAGTYWFHPHPHGRTGEQVYRGLAGLFLVSDTEEAALDLPSGEYDLPLVIQDRNFDSNNQLVYNAGTAATASTGGSDGGMSGGMMGGMNHGNMGGDMMQGDMNSMMHQMMGQRGDRILVNGQVDAQIAVATRPYRLRLVNGSNARLYKLAWDDETPLTVIGSDGGLLAAPVEKPYVTLAPGERVELWADFSNYPVGSEVQLRSLAFAGMEMGSMMMDGMMEAMMDDPLPSGVDFPVLRVQVARQERASQQLPQLLTSIEQLDAATAFNAGAPLQIDLFMNAMQWTLDGRTFEMTAVSAEETVPLGALGLWEFSNRAGSGMMDDFMAHPMHIHGVQFQVVAREVDSSYAAGWQTLSEGFVDEGWKDTVLVMPGERVRLLMRFTEPGLFVYHCHILEHEDMGMMRNFLVEG